MEYLHLTKNEAVVIWDISSLNKVELKELIASGKEYKKVDIPMEEYIKNYVPKQLDIFKVDL